MGIFTVFADLKAAQAKINDLYGRLAESSKLGLARLNDVEQLERQLKTSNEDTFDALVLVEQMQTRLDNLVASKEPCTKREATAMSKAATLGKEVKTLTQSLNDVKYQRDRLEGLLLNQEKANKTLVEEIEHLKFQAGTSDEYWKAKRIHGTYKSEMRALGWDVNKLGTELAKFCKNRNDPIMKIPDETYGVVNAYPAAVVPEFLGQYAGASNA